MDQDAPEQSEFPEECLVPNAYRADARATIRIPIAGPEDVLKEIREVTY